MGIMRRFDVTQLPTGSYSISGSFSGSFFGDGSGLTGITTTIDTGSFATTGSNNFIGSQVITGSVDVKNGNVNIESNSYFFQGTSTDGSNVSLIGVNNQNEVYIGNQGYTNIIADDTNIEGDTQITGSAIVTGSLTVTGSIYTDSVIYSPFTIGLNFETATSYTYKTPYTFQINSIESDPSGSLTIIYQSSGSTEVTASYTLGTTINKFDKLIITPATASLIVLNSIRI
jgi:hypothetical protein